MEKSIQEKIQKLSLRKKAEICTGSDFWHLHAIDALGLPKIMVSDGPHGLRKQESSENNLGVGESLKATCYPTASLLASSWDTDLMYQVGQLLAKECLSEEVSVILGPGANIKRHPLCGRNFEYFSEDPFLSGKLASSYITGVQDLGVGTSLKHFVANNQETRRMVMDSIIDERTLHEIYLKSFEIPIKEASPWTVMCSYNLLNGTYLSENKTVLSDILRDKWGFKGLVVTDWGACNNRVKGIQAGQDLEMPGSGDFFVEEIVSSVEKKELDEQVLNRNIERIISLQTKASLTLNKDKYIYNKDEHHQKAREIASQSMVLLKNNDNILPLSKIDKVGFIGEFIEKPRYQGSGSSLIHPNRLVNMIEAYKQKTGKDILYKKGYSLTASQTDNHLVGEAIILAKEVDKVVLMIGLPSHYESEGFDRTHLNIPDSHVQLIEEISKVNKNLIVVLSNGAPVSMPWKDLPMAILEAYLGGEASQEAILDILYGDQNPSGKLAETFPNHLDEFPANKNFPGEQRQVKYAEGLYVGYRYYLSADVIPLFPFGHGLSYSSFYYSDLFAQLYDGNIDLEFNLKNTSDIDGKEVIQVYSSLPISKVYRPMKELKGFSKVTLKAGETKKVHIIIQISDLKIYNNGDFLLEEGLYNLYVGGSSINTPLMASIDIKSDDKIQTDDDMIYKMIDSSFNPSVDDFHKLYHHDFPEVIETRPFHYNSTLEELRKTLIGKVLYSVVLRKSKEVIKNESADESVVQMFQNMIKELPFRNIVVLGQGIISKNQADGLLLMMNRHFFKGLKLIFKKR